MFSLALKTVSATARPRCRPTVAATSLLLLLVVIIYGQTARFDFVHWDDPSYITDNYNVLSGLTWKGLLWALTSTHFSNWHPLTWLSHQFGWSLFGPWAGGHHLLNVGLHAANTLLCYFFLKQTTQAPWRSLLVAMLFAVHPLHVETVAWLSDRKGLLAAFFWWLALFSWLRYARGAGRAAYLASIGLHACALMAKPMAVSFPVVLFALDIWPLRRAVEEGVPLSWRRSIVEKLPFFSLSAISAGLTYYAQDLGGAVVAQSFLPLADRITNAVVAYQDYLVGLVWPVGLSFFYAYPLTWPVGRILLAMILVSGLVYLVVAERRRRPYLLAGWLWFSIMLGPVIGLVQVGSQSHADRYMYLTSTGAFIALVWSLPDISRAGRARRLMAGALVAIIVAVLAAQAYRQTSTWRTSEILYRSALVLDERNYVAHLLLSERLVEQGDWERAEPHARRALAYSDSDSVQAYGNRVLGRVALARGQFAEARAYFRRTLTLVPNSPKTHLYLGQVEVAAGDLEAAYFWLGRALQLRSRFPEALEAAADLHARTGRYDRAVVYQREAVLLRPWLPAPQQVLVGYLLAAGQPVEAAAESSRLARKFPGYQRRPTPN